MKLFDLHLHLQIIDFLSLKFLNFDSHHNYRYYANDFHNAILQHDDYVRAIHYEYFHDFLNFLGELVYRGNISEYVILLLDRFVDWVHIAHHSFHFFKISCLIFFEICFSSILQVYIIGYLCSNFNLWPSNSF